MNVQNAIIAKGVESAAVILAPDQQRVMSKALRLQHEISQLNELYAAALVACAHAGISQRVMADYLDIGPNTVQRKLKAAGVQYVRTIK